MFAEVQVLDVLIKNIFMFKLSLISSMLHQILDKMLQGFAVLYYLSLKK